VSLTHRPAGAAVEHHQRRTRVLQFVLNGAEFDSYPISTRLRYELEDARLDRAQM
jgi:hypothetical protein